ncbi:MAG: thiamine pyrophosphate-binding protein [Myxococcota bacterium]
MEHSKRWLKVLEPGELPDGRVKTVTCGRETLCMVHHEGQYAALSNRCPHQGGPLGEGSIEKGLLRCPWHGWDYDPLTGKSPGAFEDDPGVPTFPVETREDGVYVAFEEEAPHVRTSSDVIAETFANWGVRHVWGMVGHSNLGLADAIRRQVEAGKMAYYGIRHEGAASFAASAYGKLTGRPAACLSIAGPGATNLLTGLWDANVDRAPVLALTGQVDVQVLGPGAFQEVDLTAAFGKVAQWSQPVLHSSRFHELANLACKSAILNRGVSHLIFPDDVQTLEVGERTKVGSPEGRLPKKDVPPSESAFADALALLRKSKRPAIIVGHGSRFEMHAVIALADQLGAPVLTTFKAKGQISDHHPLGCGVLGRSGTPIASHFMNEADVLLVFGASFSNHTGITPKIPIVQIDLDPMMLGKFHPVTVPVLGEVGITARRLKEALAGHETVDQRGEIAERWTIWRSEKARRREDRGEGLSSAFLFEALTKAAPRDAILPVDVGNNTYSFGRYFECDAHAVLMSGYLGSIGFSVGAAMGAWAATQEAGGAFAGRKVLSVSGDGGLGQFLGDLSTWSLYNMKITHVLLHNDELGKISKEQRAGRFPVWQTKLRNPNFAKFAEDLGFFAVRVEKEEELEEALAKAIAHEGPSLVEVMTDTSLI